MQKSTCIEIEVDLELPYIHGIKGSWRPDKAERDAAWEMYLELTSRISITSLKPGDSSLREALSSLYTIFNATRVILREHGPSVAQIKRDGSLSLGHIAVAIMNTVLRPILAKWHPLLLDYEKTKENSVSVLAHERKWERYEELLVAVNEARGILIKCCNLLAEAAGVTPLIEVGI